MSADVSHIVLEVIKRRRTARAYAPTPVPDALIDQLLEAIRWAPSAANRQPWELVVVDDAETKARMRDAFLADAATYDAAYQSVSRKQADLLLAPVLIAVCGDVTTKDRFINVGSIPELGKEDLFLMTMGAAIQNLLLAATSLGLSSTWMARPARLDTIVTILDVPAGVRLVSIVAVGYAAEEPPFHESLRVPIAQKTHQRRFGRRRAQRDETGESEP